MGDHFILKMVANVAWFLVFASSCRSKVQPRNGVEVVPSPMVSASPPLNETSPISPFKISFVIQPGTQISNRLTTTATVGLLDANGNQHHQSTDSLTVSLEIMEGSGKLVSADAPVVDGIATFAEIRFDRGGPKKLKATLKPSGVSVESEPFELDSLAGIAKSIVFYGHDTVIAEGIQNKFSVKILDHYGEVVPHFTGSLRIEASESIPGLPKTIELAESDNGLKENIISYAREYIGTYTMSVKSISDNGLQATSQKVFVHQYSPFHLGKYSACVIKDEKLRCWGLNDRGQLAHGATTSFGDQASHVGQIPVSNIGAVPVAVSLGNYHSCVLTKDLKIKCFGNNSSGQCGVGNTANLGDSNDEVGDGLPYVQIDDDKRVLKVAASCNSVCALLEDQSLKCWGSGTNGVLGNGSGNSLGHTAETLPRSIQPINLGTGRYAVDFAIGCSHVCAVLDDRSVKCWGSNANGALGIEAVDNRGDQANEMGDFLPVVNLGAGILAKRVVTGSANSCAVLANNSLKCWGANNAGQLGRGNTNPIGGASGHMGDNLPIVDLGTDRIIRSIVAGSGGGGWCALLDNGQTKCWGQNTFGQLGIGTTTPKGDEPNEMGDNLPVTLLGSDEPVVSIQHNFNNACAYFLSGKVKCWGSGANGLNMQGTTTTLGGDPNTMGTNLPFIDFGGT